MSKPERMAPGHVYQPSLGTGIQWEPGQAHLWEGGKVTESAAHSTASPWEYFYTLRFVEDFPGVTHWWFRSAWTQHVRLTRPQGSMDAETIWGYMQFIDESVPAQMWTVSQGERPVIATPYPPNEVQAVNLPLRLALARLVTGILTDDVLPDTWMVITSLVQRHELALALPEREDALPFALEGVTRSMRAEFCRLQGVKE